MGLDWYVTDKPKAGKEDRVEEIWDIMNEFDGDPLGYMYQDLERELKDLVITPMETLEGQEDFPVDYRGKNVAHSEILSDDLRERAYENHSAEGMLDYANRMEEELRQYKEREIYDANDDGMSCDEKSYEYEVISSSIGWLRFWGKLGHGMNTWS